MSRAALTSEVWDLRQRRLPSDLTLGTSNTASVSRQLYLRKHDDTVRYQDKVEEGRRRVQRQEYREVGTSDPTFAHDDETEIEALRVRLQTKFYATKLMS
jgi:hypothetical protein